MVIEDSPDFHALSKAACRQCALAVLVACVVVSSGCSKIPDCRIADGAGDDVYANGVCIVSDGSRFLLVQHRFSGEWGLPGGRGRAGEPAQCAAHRETWEEARVLVEVGGLVAQIDDTRIYRCSLSDDEFDGRQSLLSRVEIAQAEWVDGESIGELDWRFRIHRAVIRRIVRGREP